MSNTSEETNEQDPFFYRLDGVETSAGVFKFCIDKPPETKTTTLTISGEFGLYQFLSSEIECVDEDAAIKVSKILLETIRELCSQGLLYNPS